LEKPVVPDVKHIAAPCSHQFSATHIRRSVPPATLIIQKIRSGTSPHPLRTQIIFSKDTSARISRATGNSNIINNQKSILGMPCNLRNLLRMQDAISVCKSRPRTARRKNAPDVRCDSTHRSDAIAGLQSHVDQRRSQPPAR